MNISDIIHSKTSAADVIQWDGPSSQQPQAATNPGAPSSSLTATATADANPYLLPASTSRTALLCIDIQRGINTSSGHFGTQRSTPRFEENIASILSTCRHHNNSHTNTNHASHPIRIFHVYHRSNNPHSPLHPNSTTQPDGMSFMPCAEPAHDSDLETTLAKSTSSAFCGTGLAELLKGAQLEQLIVAGLVTDHCVGNSVRWARDLDVVVVQQQQQTSEEGKIVIVGDATACFAKGGFDAETVQSVNLASLEGEFAHVMSTSEVLGQLFAS